MKCESCGSQKGEEVDVFDKYLGTLCDLCQDYVFAQIAPLKKNGVANKDLWKFIEVPQALGNRRVWIEHAPEICDYL